MKYYIIAGEASGDLHGSNLIKEIKKNDREALFQCWGGPMMENQGAILVKNYKELAFMGFWEVFIHLRTIFKNLRFCKNDILKFKPDVVILIDYPGFNLRIAKFVKKAGFPVVYYISPQLWAWKESRIKTIKKYVDKMLVILPFEELFFQKHNYKANFVGHPLLDAIKPKYTDNSHSAPTFKKPVIALLPGSRKQEISKMLPIMLSIQDQFNEYDFVIAGATSISSGFYAEIIGQKNVSIIWGQTYELLEQSVAAIVTSGTATLETALHKVPQIVCYKSTYFSYAIAKKLIKVPYISLVNLILEKPVVKELIQHELNYNNLTNELIRILKPEIRSKIIDDYNYLEKKLGGPGASERAANIIHPFLTSKE
jgi:lipid-A-disaccharide synthase